MEQKVNNFDDLLRQLKWKSPATGRGLNDYHKLLFPDCKTREEMFSVLQKRKTIDIGCGLTHRNPYSLMNEIARREHETMMIGIDRRLSYPFNHPEGYNYGDIFAYRTYQTISDLWRIFTGKKVQRDTPACQNVIGADVRAIPFPDASFHQVLSSYCYPFWFPDEELDAPLMEMDRVAKPGGQIRLYPISKVTLKRLLRRPSIESALTRRYKETMHQASGKLTLILDKQE